MHAHEVIRVDGAARSRSSRSSTASVGLGWLPDGRMLIVSMADRRLLRREPDGTLVEHADLSPLSRYQINDMVVDGHGHAYVGQMGYDLHGGGGASAQPAALLRVDPDGSAHEAADGMRVANGMAVANDDRTLIVAESAGKDLVAFDIGADGTLSNRRVWAELPDYPDGMCIDAEDGVWFACPVGDRFMRVVEGGDVTDEIAVPGRHRSRARLGGADGRTLFMLTAPTLGNPDESRAAMDAPHRDHRRHRPRRRTAVTMERGLSDIRVLDFSTGIAGAYTTKLFADAGADVVKVEPPGGDPLRRWSASGAALGDADGPLFRFLNASKRSVVATADDDAVRVLAEGADLVVESNGPGPGAFDVAGWRGATPRWSSCRSRPAA